MALEASDEDEPLVTKYKRRELNKRRKEKNLVLVRAKKKNKFIDDEVPPPKKRRTKKDLSLTLLSWRQSKHLATRKHMNLLMLYKV